MQATPFFLSAIFVLRGLCRSPFGYLRLIVYEIEDFCFVCVRFVSFFVCVRQRGTRCIYGKWQKREAEGRKR